MADITLNKITSAYNLSRINENFSKIQDTLNTDRLALTDSSNPPTMDQDLDMNGHRVLNTILSQDSTPTQPNDLIRLQDLQGEASLRQAGDDDLQQQINDVLLSQASGVVGYATKAAMQADTGRPVGTVAQVTNDPTTANNTTYRWDGTTWVTAVDRVTIVQNNLDSYSASISASSGSASVGFINSGTGAVARTLQAKGRDTVSLFDFGAVGNGTTDDTLAIQAAVNACVASGKTLLVPAGKFRTTAVINVGGKLQMVGEGTSVDRGAGAPGTGSWFFLNHSGQGFFLITTQQGSIFEKFGTYRSHPAPVSGWAPTVYDYDFFMSPAANEWTFKDMMLLNPYKGIKCSNRPTIKNVKMHAFKEGICIDDCRDTARLENIHIWPFWSESEFVIAYTLPNLFAFRLLRCDNPTLVSCFCIFANKGLSIEQGATGSTYALRAHGLNMDGVINGVVVDAAAVGASGTITDMIVQNSYDRVTIGTGVQIAANNCQWILNGLIGYDFPSGIVRTEGTGCTTVITGANFQNWDRQSAGNPAVFCAAGSNCSVFDYSVINSFSTIAARFVGPIITKHNKLVIGPVNVSTQADWRHAGNAVIMTANNFFYLPGLVSGSGNLPNGTEITVINPIGSGNNVSIQAVSGVTLAKNGTSANIVLVPGSSQRVVKTGDNSWLGYA